MTDGEFESYSRSSTADYALEVARNTGISEADALAQAERTTAEALPDGVRTTGQRLMVAEDEGGGRIGHLWLAHKPESSMVFIYDIEVEAPLRGQGYGRRLLELVDDEARAMGATKVELNVFADNAVARHLYESAGYREMRRQMVKHLD
jgi:ribosomal protein S18 acetylase RimI-like enzyme